MTSMTVMAAAATQKACLGQQLSAHLLLPLGSTADKNQAIQEAGVFNDHAPDREHDSCWGKITTMTAACFAEFRSPFETLHREVSLRRFSGSAPAGLKIETMGQIGRLLRHQRLGLGLTQAQMGERAGVGRRFISELESGKVSIHAGQMLQVCAAAGVLITALVDSEKDGS